jgi:hypothetical protein
LVDPNACESRDGCGGESPAIAMIVIAYDVELISTCGFTKCRKLSGTGPAS